MRVRFSPRAFLDLDEIFAYVAKDNPAAASAVVHEIERLAAQLSYFPEMGHPTDIEGIRSLSVRRYPYLIFYEITGREVVIRHVRHGARRPWKPTR